MAARDQPAGQSRLCRQRRRVAYKRGRGLGGCSEVFGVRDIVPASRNPPLHRLQGRALSHPPGLLHQPRRCGPDDHVPGYPDGFGTHAKYYGGEVHNGCRSAGRRTASSRPEIRSRPTNVKPCPRRLVHELIPNNPTGKPPPRRSSMGGRRFAFAKRAPTSIVIHDAAYAALIYRGTDRSRFLARCPVPDGCRRRAALDEQGLATMIGLASGLGHRRQSPDRPRATADVKDNSDSGQFIAIQKAAICALDDATIPVQTRAKYLRRLTKLVDVLSRARVYPARCPRNVFSSMFAVPRNGRWVEFRQRRSSQPVPDHRALDLHVPWDDAGSFLRLSATYEAPDGAAEDALMAETAAGSSKSGSCFDGFSCSGPAPGVDLGRDFGVWSVCHRHVPSRVPADERGSRYLRRNRATDPGRIPAGIGGRADLLGAAERPRLDGGRRCVAVSCSSAPWPSCARSPDPSTC